MEVYNESHLRCFSQPHKHVTVGRREIAENLGNLTRIRANNCGTKKQARLDVAINNSQKGD